MDKETKEEFENLTQIIQKSFNHVEGEISSIKDDLANVKGDLANVKDDLANVKDDLANVKDDLANVKNTMATKEDLGKLSIELRDFIDDKIVDLKGDLIVLMRKEDTKLMGVVENLRKKDVFGEKETNKILKMEPFPRLAAN